MAAFRADHVLGDIVAIAKFAYIDELIDEYMVTVLADHSYHAFIDYQFLKYWLYFNDIFMYCIRKCTSDI